MNNTQLLKQVEMIFDFTDDGSGCDIIYLDLSKAYDREDHVILLSKLKAMGINEEIMKLIEHWLMNRRQRVKVEDQLSDWDKVISGILQGSVLGLLLFILFIWDLKLNPEDLEKEEVRANILKYIDDIKVIAKVTTNEDVEKVQNVLNSGYEWEKKNNMLFNSDKFMTLRIGSEALRSETLYFTPEYMEPITIMAEAKDLEIILDYEVSFKSHMKKVVKKANNKISWILKTFTTCEIQVMRTLWKSLIVSCFDYGNVIWANTNTQCDREILERPLRNYSKRVKGMSGLNYWQRIAKLK